jgi:hypothetical protein
VFVEYEKDRAALDMGLHMTTAKGLQHHVSLARIWFQLKGIHSETLPINQYKRTKQISITIKLDHLKFWFASPEPIYLVVYVEAINTLSSRMCETWFIASGARIFWRQKLSRNTSRR